MRWLYSRIEFRSNIFPLKSEWFVDGGVAIILVMDDTPGSRISR